MYKIANKKRVAIVGCGAVAYRWYFDGIMKSENCTLAALVDNNSTALMEAGKYFGKSNNLFADYRQLFTDDICDIVLVLTPHKSHYEIVKDCLEHKLHVYSEKPFAENYLQAIELIKIAKENDVTLCSAPQVMLSSRNKKVKELINDGVIGDVTLVHASGSNMGPADRKGVTYDPTWFYQDGGSLSSLGIYTLALVQYIWGIPRSIVGYSTISLPERIVQHGPFAGKKVCVTAPDNEVSILDYGQWFVLFDGSYSVKKPEKWELIIHGSQGKLLVGGFGGKESIQLVTDHGEQEIGPEDDCHLHWNLFWGVDEQAKAILSNTVSETDASFAAETIRLIEAIRKNGKIVVF